MRPTEPLLTPEELQCLLGWPLPTAPREALRETPRPRAENAPLPLNRPWAKPAALAD